MMFARHRDQEQIRRTFPASPYLYATDGYAGVGALGPGVRIAGADGLLDPYPGPSYGSGTATQCPPGYVFATVGGESGCYDPASIQEYQQSGMPSGVSPPPGYPSYPTQYPSGYPPGAQIPPPPPSSGQPWPQWGPPGAMPQYGPPLAPPALAPGQQPPPQQCAKAVFFFDVCDATTAAAQKKARTINIAAGVGAGLLALGVVWKFVF